MGPIARRLVASALFLAGCSGLPALTPDPDGGATEADAAPFTIPPDPVPPPRGYVVISADELADSAEKFAAWRATTGFTTAVHRVSDLTAGGTSLLPAVRAALLDMRAQLPAGSGLFLLIVGDAPGRGEPTAGEVPALPCENVLGDCATDAGYGDLDGDQMPDVAIGRVPARTTAQADAFLAKAQAHEATYEVGPWNRRLSLYTGQGGFGAQIDAELEMGVMEALKALSHDFDVIGAYNNPQSPFFYTPFAAKALDLFNQGGVLVIYVGHGSSTWTEGLTRDQVDQINCAHRAPVAVFVACSNGAYVGPDDSLAEKLVWRDGGPIASIAASVTSHPYGNAVFIYEMARAALNTRPWTWGEALLDARRAIVENDDTFRKFVDTVGHAQLSYDEEVQIRTQHVNLYNLFGDPATPLHLPRTEAAIANAGSDEPVISPFVVRGAAPGIADGTALVTYEAERGVVLDTLAPIDPNHPDPATVQTNWAKAVNNVVASERVSVHNGQFQATLKWTQALSGGNYYFKVYANDATRDSFGSILTH